MQNISSNNFHSLIFLTLRKLISSSGEKIFSWNRIKKNLIDEHHQRKLESPWGDFRLSRFAFQMEKFPFVWKMFSHREFPRFPRRRFKDETVSVAQTTVRIKSEAHIFVCGILAHYSSPIASTHDRLWGIMTSKGTSRKNVLLENKRENFPLDWRKCCDISNGREITWEFLWCD